MRKMKSSTQVIKDPLSIIDAIFATKARQKIATGITGSLGVSLLVISAIIATTKPEDTYPIIKS